MPRNMVTRRIDDLLILRETKETPSDAEWDQCLDLLAKDPHRMEATKVLVITDGGGPTPDQRKRLQQTLQGAKVPVAVVTDSMRVRFIVSSVALVTSRIQSFKPSELDEAFDHLGLRYDEQRAANKNIAEMTAEIEPGVQPSA